MSKAHTLLQKVRQNIYNLQVSWTTVVLKDTGDGTEIWALDADHKPELVTTAPRDFLVVAAEIESGHCDPLEDFLAALDETMAERYDREYEYFLETRYADEYAAMPEWAK